MLSQGTQRGALVDVFVARGAVANSGARRGRAALAQAGREAALAVIGVVALALSAHVIIPLPFTPVPITGQTFAVLLLAAAYGAPRGLASVALYLLAGAAGLPVFAAVPGVASYGYLVGFALAALVVGWLAQRGWGRSFPTSIAALVAGEVAIYTCGLLWLARFVGWGQVIALGLTPFLIGDALKLLAAALLLPAAWFATRRLLGEESR
ncbi:MAG TPA: biotin transporter BioY [Ktedonobacterales bacterium]